MTLPLDGIRVVDMSQVYFGPGATVYLADQGAQVVKVETLRGDSMRHRYTTPYLHKWALSKPFLALNRNKRSVAVDVHTREGQGIVHSLAEWADVFVLNVRPGTESRLALDYDTLRGRNERLIYASISAFGREGPEAGMPGYDIVLQSRSGVLSTRRFPDGTPVPYPIMFSDMSGCMALSYAVMLALWQRERTGKGQRIDASLLNQALAMQMQQLVWVDNDPSPLPGSQATAMASCYECSDGRWLTIVVVEDYQWRALAGVLGLEHLADDADLATYEGRVQRASELGELVAGVFSTQGLEHWMERLRASGIPSAPVVQRDDLPADAQVVANRMLLEQDHPTVGRIRVVAPPFRLSESSDDLRVRSAAPTLGEHTDEVLGELGYSESSIATMRERGIVA